MTVENVEGDDFADDAVDHEESEDAEEFRVLQDTCGDENHGGGQPSGPPPVCTGNQWCTSYSSTAECENWCDDGACWWSQFTNAYECDFVWWDDCLDSCDECNCPS
ncbi:MAG: hypothetical protein KDK70_18720 [Myxococcales bacterium]|nr:hypothetical protein [Myxococcales bacterium]